MFTGRIFEVIKARFAEEPVMILEGVRATGKSTILQAIPKDLAVLIDEYQKVPEILDAI